jgi:uncharacterized repeat protein (TIGR01451 family)
MKWLPARPYFLVLLAGAAGSVAVALALSGAAAAATHCTVTTDETLCAVDITVDAGSEFTGEIGTDQLANLGNLCDGSNPNGITLFTGDYVILWGDGSAQDYATGIDCSYESEKTVVTVNASHTYAAAGSYTVTLDDVLVVSNVVSTTATATVTETTSPPTVGLSPSSVSFGDQLVGSTSTAQTVTISNTASSGSQSLAVGQLSLGGTNAADFSLGSDTCSNKSIAPGSSCTVDVAFAPAQAGARSASLSVPGNAASSPDSVALSGNGTTAPLADVKVSMSGPSSAKRGTQIAFVITVSNAGPSAAHNVVLSDPVPAGASFVGISTTNGSCTIPKTGKVSCSLGNLAAGGSVGSVASVKLTAKVGSTVTNLASAYSTADQAGAATPDPNTANNWVSLSTTVK